MEVPGTTQFQLIDEDGDELPGTWELAWEGRDPFEVVIAAVTEVSLRPWKWSSKRADLGRLSPRKCQALKLRVGKVLRQENRGRTAAVIARVVAEEYGLKPARRAEPGAIEAALRGAGAEDPDGHPELLAARMLRVFRVALKAAVEVDAGLRVSWQVGSR